ncbi:MAG: purine-binding chemotaxis protein CheW [Nitrospirae bacterium]|nr:purine-binding chemotaxis protein CheW [Nitrospirota bacterium]
MAEALANNKKKGVLAGQRVEGQEYVTFYLNEEVYAFEALRVQEIIELTDITKVPHLPDYLKGVINLRGTIIPIVDLKQKFTMGSGEYKKHTCIIVTEFSGGVMGLIVDAVSDILNLDQESISATPSFGTKINTEFIAGMGRVDDGLVLVLDVEKVLSPEEATVVANVALSGQEDQLQTCSDTNNN